MTDHRNKARATAAAAITDNDHRKWVSLLADDLTAIVDAENHQIEEDLQAGRPVPDQARKYFEYVEATGGIETIEIAKKVVDKAIQYAATGPQAKKDAATKLTRLTKQLLVPELDQIPADARLPEMDKWQADETLLPLLQRLVDTVADKITKYREARGGHYIE